MLLQMDASPHDWLEGRGPRLVLVACILVACILVACILVACILVACILVACILVACILVACIDDATGTVPGAEFRYSV
jgi:hypothetical protein